MADVTVSTLPGSNYQYAMRSVVFTNRDTGYYFYIGSGNDFDYHKTTDGGKTWGSGVDIFTGTVIGCDVWYDQWTSGDTGRIIHMWYFDTSADTVTYRQLNTVTDTLSTAVNVFVGGSAVGGRGVFVSGTKASGGNLYCCFDIDGGTEKGFYRSVDNGATWTARTDPVEATLDQALLFPANAADSQDIWLLYDDDSATELTVQTYDDSGNSFSESAALTFDNDPNNAVGQYGFSGSIRHSDGHLIFAFFNAYDAVGEDFLCYDWDGSTATALTALTTDIDDMYYPSVYLNQDQPDYIYIAYIGKSDGLETLGTTNSVYYALSKNRGVTWTMDTAYSASSTDYRHTWAPLNGERFLVLFLDISAVDTLTNNDNSKEFGFTGLNNFQSGSATGVGNTGIISVAERVR